MIMAQFVQKSDETLNYSDVIRALEYNENT